MKNFSSMLCPELTERQIQIAMLIAQFKTNDAIARELGICYSVVAEHIKKMFSTLGFDCRMQLVIWMLKKGIITLDEIMLPNERKDNAG